MSDKIIPIGGITKLEIPIDKVLEGAKDQLEGVLLIGFDKNGELYTASTYSDGGDIMWLLEACKHRLWNNLESNEEYDA